uniref:3-oxoacyl-[acyl-carrier protein] reductase n=1 Tax=Sphingomonas sp. JE1 TaxID=1628059 RepID=A0A0D5A011_9SPHN|nr:MULTISPECIES: SDR family oxidoreductase [unclassified Sphingomonas]AJW29526.1 3-oxoacyl-[acyl-carrier protein] reductase [Sphingomonas sp. JE1]
MESVLDFTGKTVLVVGGSSGIGNGIARAFLARGAQVHVIGTRAAATDYEGEDGSNLDGLHYSALDVTDDQAVAAYSPAFDRLDILILSQGLVKYGRAEFEMAEFRRVTDVNLMSAMACAIRFRPMLADSNGSLIIISSVAAFLAAKGNPAYNASKAGVTGLARNLGQAWAGEGIRVNAIAPGLVETKLTRITTGNAQRLASTLTRIPLGRLGTVDEIAGVALFLASPLSSYMIGQTLLVDGGRLL